MHEQISAMAISSQEAGLKGGCQCGAITYSSNALPTHMTNCHCQTCRKLSGAPFMTFASFPKASITWTSGESSTKKTWYSKVAERAHCPDCGSPLYMYYYGDADEIGILAGTIDENTVQGVLPKPSHHLFVGDGKKAGWYDLPDDGLRRSSGMPTES